MQQNIILVGLLALVIGVGIGFGASSLNRHSYGEGDRYERKGQDSPHGGGRHMMPDGTMMDGAQGMSMDEMMESMNANLKGKTGDEFDRVFLSEMIVHHKGAVEMAELAKTNAGRQEIKDLASAIVSAQNKEINEMEGWQKSWFIERE